ncbi:MAG: hypothetical protein N2663_07805, partial [Chlorobi bacterium]|nr:hypothetical protein [Chlorobiota bacterium]
MNTRFFLRLCVSFLTLLWIVNISSLIAAAQFFIENRGQWDHRIRFVGADGRVLVMCDGVAVWRNNGWERVSCNTCTARAEEVLPACANYYTADTAIEHIPLARAVIVERNGQHIACLQWRGHMLEVRSNDPLGTSLAPQMDSPQRQDADRYALSWGIGGRFVGSSGRDSIAAMAVADGSVFVCGWTDSPSFPGASGTPNGGREAFVAKVAPDGTLQWATLIGGTSDDVAYSLSVRSDLVAIVGMTRSTNFPTTAGAVQATYGGGDADGFAVLLNPSTGTRQAATYIGGDGSDAMRAVALGAQRLAIGGSTTSAALPATAHQQQFGGVQDGYIAVLNTQLSNRIWSSYYGGRGFDDIRGCGWLSDGSLVIAGITNSPNTAQAIAAGLGEGSQRMAPPDGFLARLDANGQRLWGRYYGSDGQDSITHLSISP